MTGQLSSHDPIGGRRVDFGLDALEADEQLGIAGTTMPDRNKPELNAIYVLKEHIATLPKETRGDTVLTNKIQERIPGARVSTKRSGRSSKAPFEEQAIIVRLSNTMGREPLPVTDRQLHDVASVIQRHLQGLLDRRVAIKGMILDTAP